jgi:anti-sigma factor (TIGR02949 family)
VTCRVVRRHLGVLVDGEVDPATQIEFERHLMACAPCQEELAIERAMRAQVREALRGPSAPAGLRGRVLAALDAVPEDETPGADDRLGERSRHREDTGAVRVFSLRPRYAVPLAAAAAALFVLGLPSTSERRTPAADAPAVATSSLLADVVRLHSHALPADVKGPEPVQVVRYFDDKVGFPVRAARFDRSDVQLTGARLAHVRDRRAAALYYDVRGRRMTLVVFEPPAAAFPEPAGLRARLGARDVYYQQVGGHVVPVRRQGGLTYAMTGDLPRRQLLSLAASFEVP